MVKYEWDESNGVSVPTNKLMAIDADEYYVGMPLKKVDAETVAPTDGDPEYICLAQRNAGDEIRPLQIPVQEVFPDAVYTKIMEDGTEEKVKFGGGGGAILDSNGKLKNEVLPEGYPYKTVEEFTVEHIPNEEYWYTTVLEGFPAFVYGDVVELKVDDTEYSLAVNEDYSIGDSYDDVGNGGKYGWGLMCEYNPSTKTGYCYFYSFEPHTVGWDVTTITNMANEFLNDDVAVLDSVGDVITIEWDGDTTGCPYFVCNGFRYYRVGKSVIPFEHLESAESKRSDEEYIQTSKGAGTNCYDLHSCIVVTQAGECVDSNGSSFSASTEGVYCIKHNFTTGTAWCEYVKLDARRKNSALYLTNPSGVKYAITVDDNGIITATEV